MGASRPVYLDNHSTTRVDPRVVDAMNPYWAEEYGNAASRQHEYGWRAEAAIVRAREQVASLVGASAEEVVFTSGATESINLALKGIAETSAGQGRHVITAATEHRAVLDTARRLEQYGFRVTVVPVDGSGLVDPDQVEAAMIPGTILVSVMLANNEIGTIGPIEELAARCRRKKVLLHSDAVQAAGKIPVNVQTLGVDLLSLSAHKMHGPKGVGALVVRKSGAPVRLAAQLDGGGHERGMRSGTLNVPAIVGFGAAAEIALREGTEDASRMSRLRGILVDGILDRIDEVIVNGHPVHRLPNNANLTFPGASADAVMMEMRDIAVSSGSACSSAVPEPSHVLKAIGRSVEDARSSIRFGLGRFTTEEEIVYAVGRVAEAVSRVRARTRALV